MNKNDFLSKELEAFEKDGWSKMCRYNPDGPVLEDAIMIDLETAKHFLAESHSRLIHAITEEVRGKKLENQKTESDSDWFFGCGYNAALSEITKLLEQSH